MSDECGAEREPEESDEHDASPGSGSLVAWVQECMTKQWLLAEQ